MNRNTSIIWKAINSYYKNSNDVFEFTLHAPDQKILLSLTSECLDQVFQLDFGNTLITTLETPNTDLAAQVILLFDCIQLPKSIW